MDRCHFSSKIDVLRILYVPVSFDKDMVSPSLEKFTEYDHWKIKERQNHRFVHLHEYDCIWEAST